MNFTGNSKKSMHMSVEASLQKLKTSYIDLLYVHWCMLHERIGSGEGGEKAKEGRATVESEREERR